MEKVKVCVDFSVKRYSDKDLEALGKNVGEKLSSGTDYPSLVDTGKAIMSAATQFGSLLIEMLDSNKQTTALKNEAREVLVNALTGGALSVQKESNGNEIMIRKSGYDIVIRSTAPVGVLPQVLNVQTKQGPYTGSIEIRWDGVEKASFYEVRYTPYPATADSVYMTRIFSKTKNALDGLNTGIKYVVNVSAIGTDPHRIWSVDVITPYIS